MQTRYGVKNGPFCALVHVMWNRLYARPYMEGRSGCLHESAMRLQSSWDGHVCSRLVWANWALLPPYNSIVAFHDLQSIPVEYATLALLSHPLYIDLINHC